MASGGFIGSLTFGQLSDHPKCNRILACQFSILSMGIVCTLVTIASSFTWLAVLAFAFGVFDGCYEMLVPVITSDIVGFKMTPIAIGTLYCVLAIPKTIGPPVAGWIFDVSQSYNTAFYVTGGVMTLSSIIMFLIPQTNVMRETMRIASSSAQDVRLVDNSDLTSTTITTTTSTTTSITTSFDGIPARKFAALTCYGLRYKNRQRRDDYYTTSAQERLLVAEKITSV